MLNICVALLLVTAVITSSDVSHKAAEFSLLIGNPSLGFMDPIDSINLEVLGASAFCQGVAYDPVNQCLWVSDGASQAGDSNQIHVITLDGILSSTFPQNGTSGLGLRDLCYSDDFGDPYVFGSDDNEIDLYDMNGVKQYTFYSYACNPNRALAYDGTYFYTGNLSNVVYQLYWDGASGSTATYIAWSTAISNNGVSGLAYDGFNDCMWVSTASSDNLLYQLDMTGSLINTYSYGIISAAGCATGGDVLLPVQDRALWVVDPGPPSMLRAYELMNIPELERETWGTIKTLF